MSAWGFFRLAVHHLPMAESSNLTLTPESGGTRLTVTESGFAAAAMEEKARRRAHADNSQGWEIELDAARAYLEAPASPAA